MGLDILGFFGDIIWMAIGMALGMWFSIVLWSIILGYTDFRGYLRWKNENSVC
jgi:hypothetical protein